MNLTCFVCNHTIDQSGKVRCALITESIYTNLSVILDTELSMKSDQNYLCKNCKQSVQDHENLIHKLESVSNRLNSLYKITLQTRENDESNALIKDLTEASNDSQLVTEELYEIVDDGHKNVKSEMKEANDALENSIIVVYQNGENGQLFDSNLVEIIEATSEDDVTTNDYVTEMLEEDSMLQAKNEENPTFEIVDELIESEKDDVDSKSEIPMEFYQEPYAIEGKIYFCKFCARTDNSCYGYDYHTMEIHLKTKHCLRIFICADCGVNYKRKVELNEHIDLVHKVNVSGGYQYDHCDQCDKKFKKSELRLFRAHKRTHNLTSSANAFECDVCDKKFLSVNLLADHQNIHLGHRPFKCPYCPKDFASKYTLTAHLKIHSERPRQHQCILCTKSFFTQSNLVSHMKIHSGVKEYICEVCNKAFATEHNLQVHKIVHSDFKPFICRWPECGKAFARRNEIRDHERTHTGEKPFGCDFCSARFSQRSNLLSHKKATHLNEKRHECDTCKKAFKRRRLLDYHIKSFHTGERPHKCEICLATFVYPEHYKKHLRIHTGTKNYRCEYCNKSFTSTENRNSHRFTHTDIKPYECRTCGAGFMRKPSLFAHIHEEKHDQETIVMNKTDTANIGSTVMRRVIVPVKFQVSNASELKLDEISTDDQFIMNELEVNEYDTTIEMIEEGEMETGNE